MRPPLTALVVAALSACASCAPVASPATVTPTAAQREPSPSPRPPTKPAPFSSPTATAPRIPSPTPDSSCTGAPSPISDDGKIIPRLAEVRLTMPFDVFPDELESLEAASLQILDQSGASAFANELDRAEMRNGTDFFVRDFTDDSKEDIAFFIWNELVVMGCLDGRYQTLLNFFAGPWPEDYWAEVLSADDLTAEGIPDLAIAHFTCQRGGCLDAYIFTWNGTELANVLEDPSGIPPSMVSAHATLQDIEGDDPFELILKGGIPSDFDRYTLGPWREETQIYAWNGTQYALTGIEFSPAEYRYQAVQDGDRLTEKGDLDSALAAYQDAIFSDKLKPWSREWSEYQTASGLAMYETGEPIPPTPTLSSTEYSQLAAYARYRILVLHTANAHMKEAQTVFDTLVGKFPPSDPGYLYVQLATEYWQRFLRGQDLAASCQGAIGFAESNPTLLEPLGSDFHGPQDRKYQPEDVCPFR